MEKVKKEYIDMELVRALMKAKDIDEKMLAEKIGVTPQTVKKYLGGADQRHMPVLTLFKITRALDVSIPTIIHKDYHKLPEKKSDKNE